MSSEYRVTIRDIAEEVGVSTATVSNVLHGKKNKVSQSVIEKVEKALEKNNYIPSMAAILLGRNSSRIIGVIIKNHKKYHNRVLEDGFISSSLNALSLVSEEEGYFLMIKITSDILSVPEFSSMWNMEALVLIGFCDDDYSALRNKTRIPFVVYDGITVSQNSGVVSLILDDYEAGKKVGQYYKEMGHKRILIISDNNERMDGDRISGLKYILPSSQLLLVSLDKDTRWNEYKERLDYINSFTGVFCLSDFYALDFISFLSTQGFSVPSFISVIGFDGTLMADIEGLTTIKQNYEERAKKTIKVIKKMLNNEKVESIITISNGLVKGYTVKRLCD